MTPASLATLTNAREDAAAHLEVAIVAVGEAFVTYKRTTAAVSDRTGAKLDLEIPITLHLVRAGLGELLARKLALHGRLASLRELCEARHRDLTVGPPGA